MSAPLFTPCRDWPGYEVSSDGRVRSTASNWRGYGVRELAQQPNASGYASVRLTRDGKRTRMTVHRLVAVEFLPAKPDWANQIRHLDGDRSNPRADNLAWGNAALNAADRTAHGTAAKITPEKRDAMRAGYRLYLERRANVGA